MEEQVYVKDLLDILDAAKSQSQYELDKIASLGLAPIGELEQRSFYKGKIHVLEGIIEAFLEQKEE